MNAENIQQINAQLLTVNKFLVFHLFRSVSLFRPFRMSIVVKCYADKIQVGERDGEIKQFSSVNT